MMLTGSSVRPDKAKKLGLVDLVVDPACLESVAIAQVTYSMLCVAQSYVIKTKLLDIKAT